MWRFLTVCILLLGILGFITVMLGNDGRKGISKDARNYSDTVFRNDPDCMLNPGILFVFHHLDADSVARAIRAATVKYFGENFSTRPVQDTVYHWLKHKYFSRDNGTGDTWTLDADFDTTKMTCGFPPALGLQDLGIGLMYINTICPKKLV